MATEIAKIQIRRGNNVDLPVLAEGEPSLSTDTKQIYVGSDSGNIELAKQSSVDSLQEDVTSLSNTVAAQGSAIEANTDSVSRMSTDISSIKNFKINVLSPPAPLTPAKGDGVTNDSPAIQAMINLISSNGGGHLTFPANNYSLGSLLEMCSNIRITISVGATLINNTGAETLFWYPSQSTGYSGGLHDIHWDGGGRIFGNFDNNGGQCHAMHHVQNFSAKNLIFDECNMNSHVFDLGGCDNILIEDCTFIGKKILSGREYTEAIQTDFSAASGLTRKTSTDIAACDGLPTRNVTVRRCRFLPKYNSDGSIKYYAPHPIGTHSQWGMDPLKNIRFEENYVEDTLPDTINNSSDSNKGIIHSCLVDGFYVLRNKFVVTTSLTTRAVTLNTRTSVQGTDITNLQATNPTYTEYANTPDQIVSHKNVVIEGNRFEGFKSPSTNSNLIKVAGYSVDYGKPQNVKVNNNTFIDCYDVANLNDDTIYGLDLIALTYVDGFEVDRNFAKYARRVVYIIDSNGSVTNNDAEYVCYVPYVVTSSNSNLTSDITVSGNKASHCRGAYHMVNLSNLIFVNNKCVNDEIPTNSGYAGYALRIKAGNMIVTGNILQTSHSVATGITVDTLSGSKGYVKGNILTGFTTPVSNSNTNVDSSDNK